MKVNGKHYRTVRQDGRTVWLINQPLIPHVFEVIPMRDHKETAKAISTMIVRGAGAIGATGAAGMAQAALEAPEASFHAYVADAATTLRNTRPTAQNLFYGIEVVLKAIEDQGDHIAAAREAAVAAAQEVADDDAACCEAIGKHGAPLIEPNMGISTHCNAGWLAFVDWGSALSPVFVAHRAGVPLHVYADETRPRSQGSRLTAFELAQEGVPHTVVVDNTAGHLMQRGKIQMVIVGSDRIAANGDVCNKIGTYSSAVVAKYNNIPFYVAAPTTTIDPDCPTGMDIPIEERGREEVANAYGWSEDGRFMPVSVTNASSPCLNIAFDVTPGELVAGIITEKGIVPATPAGMASVLRRVR
jgi:methylthioribose-1-phosphate isomerase